MSNPQSTLVCLNCGFSHILYRHCKIVCENCGFLLDCSDLDVGGEIQRAHVDQQREKRSAYDASHRFNSNDHS